MTDDDLQRRIMEIKRSKLNLDEKEKNTIWKIQGL